MIKRLRVMGTSDRPDDRQICVPKVFAGTARVSLKRVKIIYEVAGIVSGTEEYRFSTERRTCLDASTRAIRICHRVARDPRRYRPLGTAVYLARVCVQNRVHVD